MNLKEEKDITRVPEKAESGGAVHSMEELDDAGQAFEQGAL